MAKRGDKLKASELQLGDVVIRASVTLENSDWCTMVVTQIEGDEVTFFRPYATTSDFSYTGGVIPYIGIEIFKVYRPGQGEYILCQRKEVK